MKAGQDPTHNYMNYPEDACLKEFTKERIMRMREQTLSFRPDLLADSSLTDEAKNTLYSATLELSKWPPARK